MIPSPTTIDEEQALLRRALKRDAAAVDALIRYLEPRLLLKANALLGHRRGSRRDALDLVQAAWADLIANDWRALRSWDPARGVPLLGYVGMVATRKMISELRGTRSEGVEVATPAETLHDLAKITEGAEATVANREYLEIVLTQLRAELTTRADRTFEVLYLEGASVEDAAATTGMTRDAIYTFRGRIREKARAIAESLARGSGVGRAHER